MVQGLAAEENPGPLRKTLRKTPVSNKRNGSKFRGDPGRVVSWFSFYHVKHLPYLSMMYPYLSIFLVKCPNELV